MISFTRDSSKRCALADTHFEIFQELANDWNEKVRETAVEQLANATKSDDMIAVDAILKALEVRLPPPVTTQADHD